MICYTRNFEDIILQRVFSDVPTGCYVDVGAAMPVTDSNTYGLYTKGWRGVALEPQGGTDEWRRARPGDVHLAAVAGRQKGRHMLHVFDAAKQASSGDPATIRHVKAHGFASHLIDVPMVTLNEVIERYLPDRPLHLVSIDVEGMEQEVLRGLDLRLHRPWVMVIEAVLAGTPQPTHAAWEPGVLEAGYQMVYLDGVNRFYLAREQRHLLGRFSLPPNVWDGFTMATERELAHRVAELEAELKAARARA